jgi:DNA topoisomerase-6 subunit B
VTALRAISVAEFFSKNRHLLGFDAPQRALVTAVKEAVDNALDACEDAGILPEIAVEVRETGDDVFRVAVEDNGPGIVVDEVARIFAKLLYGSKFHQLRQSRGQQGIGISAAGLYAQLTTGKPMRIVTRTGRESDAWELLVSIDTSHDRPDVHEKKKRDWDVEHGTRVELELEGRWNEGPGSVLRYLQLTALTNPHASLRLTAPDGTSHVFERTTSVLPLSPVAIRPHPRGVELGRLIAMLKDTEQKHLAGFLHAEFSRIGRITALRVIDRAGRGLTARSYPRRVAKRQAAALHRALGHVRVQAPRSDCIAPLGEKSILASLREHVAAQHYFATCRPPAVYRGNPFAVEVGVAYGPSRDASRDLTLPDREDPVLVLRFANRVPLVFQSGACAITRAIVHTNWRGYGLAQAKGALPAGPAVILVHIASVWVPYTSESKQAIAHYPELAHEIELALRDIGRQLRARVLRDDRVLLERKRRAHIQTYLPHVSAAIGSILHQSPKEEAETLRLLRSALERPSA